MLQKLIFLLLGVIGGGNSMAQSREQESNLKAAFIYNFTRYVEWNNNAGETEFIIGIMGSSLIDAPIQEIAKKNTVNNRRIVIRYFGKPEDIVYCHILFIPRNTATPLHLILNRVEKGVLTIGEEAGFGKMGTALNFVLDNDKLKFEANLKAINAAGLKVSSQLLKLAIIIQ